MAEYRYPHFCPVSRAAEVVGERWTLLIVRELLLGAQRFSDLRRRLHRVSPSVLSDRLERLEARGLVVRRELPPPAATAVYELTAAGRALEPVLLELGRFGARLLFPRREGDHFEPDWGRLALATFAKRGATPALRFAARVRVDGESHGYAIVGGAEGTRVREGEPEHADARFTIDGALVPQLLAGLLDTAAARASGALVVTGDDEAFEALPSLFEIDLGPADPRRKPPAEPRRNAREAP